MANDRRDRYQAALSLIPEGVDTETAQSEALEALYGVSTPPPGVPGFDDGWYGVDSLIRCETPNSELSRGRPQNVSPVEFVVIHYNATPQSQSTPTGGDVERQKRWLQNSAAGASTHFIIMRGSGEVIQAAPIDDRTWHAGSTEWRGSDDPYTNYRSIGFDLDNTGFLNGPYEDSYGGVYSGPTFEGRGKYWMAYGLEEVREACRLMIALATEFPILQEGGDRIVGHEELRDTKSDPGAAFPLWLLQQCAETLRMPTDSEINAAIELGAQS